MRGRSAMGVSVALAVAIAGCQALATPSPSPSGSALASRSPAAQTASPAVSHSSGAPTDAPTASIGPAGGHWELAGTPTINNYVFQLVPLGDGRALLLSQGTEADIIPTAQLFDPATNAWRDTEPLNKHRAFYIAVPLADGRALVTGGENDQQQSFSSTYIFDPTTETWSKSGLLATARSNAAAAVLKDGRVLVMGGYFSSGPHIGDRGPGGLVLAGFHPGRGLLDVDIPPFAPALATAELFDPATGTWSTTGSMAYARNGADAVTLADGRVLVFGAQAV
jgi:hypothetical protein